MTLALEIVFGLVIVGFIIRHEVKLWRLQRDASLALSERQKKGAHPTEYGGTHLP